MRYREHRPPHQLARWLACTWERAGDDAPVRVLPDGCIDIVWIEGEGTQIVGANTTAFLSPLPRGARVAGARLRPGAAPPIIGVAAEALRDTRVPIEDAWGAEGERLALALDASRDPAATLRDALLARARDADSPDALVGEVVGLLARPRAAVADLAGELAVSERQLRRRVSVAVGYGPKRLARVLRLRLALDAAARGDDLARVALDAGYADQTHFAHECRELAGASATALLAS